MSKSLDELVLPENARPVCNKPLPALKPEHESDNSITILLFYQYIEPLWTKEEHGAAIKKVSELGGKFNITGRARVAREGLNCTLTGKPHDMRNFCQSLRDWKSIFQETDFKLSDGIPASKMFKALSIRKTNELVAYGLAGDKAPSLKKFAGTHLEADEYHKAMQNKDTVIIDVRNAYESAIGAFKPPEGGATLLDPKMRNSVEFPKWLNSKETQKQLTGKKVLMYCTGGIRCERATALLNQMSTVQEDLKPQGVYHMRGGIERYVKTFPEGGYWKGKNYLFDRRMEQTPDIKDSSIVENDIDSCCCLCQKKWTIYRNQFKCNRSLCRVPVIVCGSCTPEARDRHEKLVCHLCREGYKAPTEMPDLVGMKRKAEMMIDDQKPVDETKSELLKKPKTYYKNRVFLQRVPLTATFTKVKEALGSGRVQKIEWIRDQQTLAFYGSCMILLTSDIAKKELLQRASRYGLKVDTKKVKICEVFKTEKNENAFHDKFVQREYPPVM